MNDVTKPRKENEWQLKENGSIVNDEQEIANTFKTFFVDKIRALKEGIYPAYVEDPFKDYNRNCQKTS